MTIQILTQAHPPPPLSTATKDDASQKASRLYQAILSELAQAFENGGTGKKTLKESLKETLLPIGPYSGTYSRNTGHQSFNYSWDCITIITCNSHSSWH